MPTKPVGVGPIAVESPNGGPLGGLGIREIEKNTMLSGAGITSKGEKYNGEETIINGRFLDSRSSHERENHRSYRMVVD